MRTDGDTTRNCSVVPHGNLDFAHTGRSTRECSIVNITSHQKNSRVHTAQEEHLELHTCPRTCTAHSKNELHQTSKIIKIKNRLVPGDMPEAEEHTDPPDEDDGTPPEEDFEPDARVFEDHSDVEATSDVEGLAVNTKKTPVEGETRK